MVSLQDKVLSFDMLNIDEHVGVIAPYRTPSVWVAVGRWLAGRSVGPRYVLAENENPELLFMKVKRT